MPFKNTVRDILLDLGVGDFNATMAIPFMLIPPRTLDPAMVQVLVVNRCLQQMLVEMGASRVRVTGVLDEGTADALTQIVGPEWLTMPYYESLRRVTAAHQAGHRFVTVAPHRQSAMGGTFDFLPSVPGGAMTYGIAALVGLHYWFKRKR